MFKQTFALKRRWSSVI